MWVVTGLEWWYIVVEIWRGCTRWKAMGREKTVTVNVTAG